MGMGMRDLKAHACHLVGQMGAESESEALATIAYMDWIVRNFWFKEVSEGEVVKLHLVKPYGPR